MNGGESRGWNGTAKEKTKRRYQDRNRGDKKKRGGNVTKVQCIPIQVE